MLLTDRLLLCFYEKDQLQPLHDVSIVQRLTWAVSITQLLRLEGQSWLSCHSACVDMTISSPSPKQSRLYCLPFSLACVSRQPCSFALSARLQNNKAVNSGRQRVLFRDGECNEKDGLLYNPETEDHKIIERHTIRLTASERCTKA